MTESPPTSFDLIESHKENIQQLSSGRSARVLAASLSPLSSNPHIVRSEHSARQLEFERELQSTHDLDDPLEVWLRYIKWTVETFPSGNSSDSGLLSLLERVTREFLNDGHYKNDPRYLKLWIQYAEDYSDNPREIFAFLLQHEVGQKLALFYESYAALLESVGNKKHAANIYQSGIVNNARPVERLHRKFEEFQHRQKVNPTEESESSSQTIATIRPALALKPLGTIIATAYDVEQEPLSQTSIQRMSRSRVAKQKLQVFTDGHEQELPSNDSKRAVGWESIGTIQHRKKENSEKSRQWAGETLFQEVSQAKTKDRLMVFRDNGSSKKAVQYHPFKSKLSERIAVNLGLVYPEEEDNEEFSFEELRAIKRGLYGVDWEMERASAGEAEKNKLLRTDVNQIKTPIKIKTALSPSLSKGKFRPRVRQPTSPTMTFHTKAATDEIYNLLNQPLQRIEEPLNSGQSDHSDLQSESDDDFTSHTQVDRSLTLEGQEDGFNHDEINPESVKDVWSDTSLGNIIYEKNDNEVNMRTSRALGKLLILADSETSNIHDINAQARKIRIPSPPENFDPPKLPYHIAKEQLQPYSRLSYMTPIVERTESLPPNSLRGRALQAAKTPSRTRSTNPLDENCMLEGSFTENSQDLPATSSPLQPNPKKIGLELPIASERCDVEDPLISQPSKPIIHDVVCNPLDESLRATIFGKLQPPLSAYEGYHANLQKKSGRATEIKRSCKVASKHSGDKSVITSARFPVLDFITGDGGSSYQVNRGLGEGAFAPVYLVQNLIVADAEHEEDIPEGGFGIDKAKLIGRNKWEALKMECPPTPWEFYIIRQGKARLWNTRSYRSIVQAHELHLFSDEGFLILEYMDQGTILDLVNLSKAESIGSNGVVMEESLVIFIAVELLRTIEDLHACGIIHGDLKPDNCLVRFEPVPDAEWDSQYQVDGSGGWSKKGILLIDFGRGIDMSLFTSTVQFVADWKTDRQDCAEMREMRPWTFQVDYHGIAAIIHTMLFGKYIETVAEGSQSVGGGTKVYRISSPLKRYWQQEIWAETFDILLNPIRYVVEEDSGCMPITNRIRSCRSRMETWLMANADKGQGLKSSIKRMGVLLGRHK